MENKSREVEVLTKQYRKQTFWKYHCTQLSTREFYLTTNPDTKHKYARNAPGYFVKLEITDDTKHELKFTFLQNTNDDNVRPFVVEKSGGLWRAKCFDSEYSDGLLIRTSNGRMNKSISLAFDNTTGKNMRDANNGLVYVDEINMDALSVCAIREKKSSLFNKSKKYDGVKLGKDKSVYFLDNQFFRDANWYDPVVAVWRPCNRNVMSKMKTGMISVRGRKNDSDDEGDGDSGDVELGDDAVKYTEFKDGLFERHPVDDSPNDFKLGWLTVYDKGRYFEKVPGGGNWEVVLGMTLAYGLERIIDKIV